MFPCFGPKLPKAFPLRARTPVETPARNLPVETLQRWRIDDLPIAIQLGPVAILAGPIFSVMALYKGGDIPGWWFVACGLVSALGAALSVFGLYLLSWRRQTRFAPDGAHVSDRSFLGRRAYAIPYQEFEGVSWGNSGELLRRAGGFPHKGSPYQSTHWAAFILLRHPNKACSLPLYYHRSEIGAPSLGMLEERARFFSETFGVPLDPPWRNAPFQLV